MRHKLLSVCLIVWILFLLPLPALAQSFDADRLGSISVTLLGKDRKTPIPDAELSLYSVASVTRGSNDRLHYIFTDPFQDCGTALEDPALTETLDAFVLDHAVPAAKQITNAHGQAVFTDLPLGLYFVKQTNTVADYAPCTSFLVTLPNETPDGYLYAVDASPKTEAAKLTSITVKKRWNTDDSTPIADSVTVQLLRNGVVVETAVLNTENHWQVTYENLPESDAYSVLEVQVPAGFTATYTQNGYVFTVTNSASLIQTGQLVWPIPVLALAGMVCIAAGTMLLQKSEKDNA